MFGPGVTQGYRVTPQSTASIRAHAQKVRAQLVPRNAPFFPMAPFIEDLFQWSIVVDVVESDVLPHGVEACCMPEKLLIMLSNGVYWAACQDEPRARFTLVHELGHLVLMHTRTFHRESQSAGQIDAYEDSEWQANTFAAEFLMPLNDIRQRGLTTAAQLQLAYQVSPQAATTRINKLNKRKEI